MGELEGQSSPEADALPFVWLWHDHLMVCLIVLTMRVIFCFFKARPRSTIGRSVASPFVGGAGNRGTGNRNRICSDVAFVDSHVGLQAGRSYAARGAWDGAAVERNGACARPVLLYMAISRPVFWRRRGPCTVHYLVGTFKCKQLGLQCIILLK